MSRELILKYLKNAGIAAAVAVTGYALGIAKDGAFGEYSSLAVASLGWLYASLLSTWNEAQKG